jgi:hypothetical protein
MIDRAASSRDDLAGGHAMTTKHFLTKLHGGFVLLSVHASGGAIVRCEDETGREIALMGASPALALERATKSANHLGFAEEHVRDRYAALGLEEGVWGAAVTIAPASSSAAPGPNDAYVPETRPAHLPSYIDWRPGMLVAPPQDVDPSLPSWLAQERKPAPSAGAPATVPASSAPSLSSLPVIPMEQLAPEVRAAIDGIQRAKGNTSAEERSAPSLDDLSPETRVAMEAIHRARVESTADRAPFTLPVPPEYAGAGDASKPE